MGESSSTASSGKSTTAVDHYEAALTRQMSPAFSKESVRQGEITGLYGRAEASRSITGTGISIELSGT